MVAILVAAMLLFTTVAVSSIFCDEESIDEHFEEFTWEDGSGGDDSGICGGGDDMGPGGPQ